MTAPLSKTQIDRLGDRLRAGPPTPSDLRLLDEHRRSFRTAYDAVVGVIRDRLGLEPTGRPAKSTGSIVEKLRRETIRLSQVQDIAGCRVVVGGVVQQERAVMSLSDGFAGAEVVDRRPNPSYGYRAVHVIVRESGMLVEVQVRTALQHQWAELSEKFSDVFDPNLKYGGGPEDPLRFLMDISEAVAKNEDFRLNLATFEGEIARRRGEHFGEGKRQAIEQQLQDMRRDAAQSKEALGRVMKMAIFRLTELKGKRR